MTTKILSLEEAKRLTQPFIGAPGFTVIMCGPADCLHDFAGWRNFEDRTGGEQVCSKCGLGAMAWTIQTSR